MGEYTATVDIYRQMPPMNGLYRVVPGSSFTISIIVNDQMLDDLMDFQCLSESRELINSVTVEPGDVVGVRLSGRSYLNLVSATEGTLSYLDGRVPQAINGMRLRESNNVLHLFAKIISKLKLSLPLAFNIIVLY